MRLPNLREESRYLGLPPHARHIAEILAEFDPDIYVEILPSDHIQFNPQKPFSVTIRPVGRESYVYGNYALHELNSRLVASFIERWNDAHGMAGYDAFEVLEAAENIMKAKQRQEELEERRDHAKTLFAIANKKSDASYNGIRLNDNVPVERPTKLYLGS